MTKYDTQGAFDKLGQDPFLPPAPAPRKSRKGWVIAGLVVAAIGIGGTVSEGSVGDDLGREAAPVVEDVITEDGGLTPEMMVDSLGSTMISDFCYAYAELGNETIAHSMWVDQYNIDLAGIPGVPSADALYYEMTSRC